MFSQVGQRVGVLVQERFGKSILELGGNNAFIVDKTAQVDSVVSGLVSGCIMTNGQCCSETRRLVSCFSVTVEECLLSGLFQFVHEDIHDEVVEKLRDEYSKLKIGDPLDGETVTDVTHTHTHLLSLTHSLSLCLSL